MCPQADKHEDHFFGNRVVLTGTDVGGLSCKAPGKTVVHDNEYFTADGNLTECGMNFTAWSAQGEDKGSKVATWPADDVIISWARAKLGF